MKRDPKSVVREKTRMEMTPMIDVTFLLLIFFLCTIKFRVLEGLIPAHLPKDVGVNSGPAPPMEKIEIVVQRTRPIEVCIAEARAAGRLAPERSWVWHEDQIDIFVGPREVKSLAEFHDLIEPLVERYRAAGIPKEDWVKATLRPMPQALYIDVVKVVNECLRAGFDQITFVGADPSD